MRAVWFEQVAAPQALQTQQAVGVEALQLLLLLLPLLLPQQLLLPLVQLHQQLLQLVCH